MSWPNGGDRLHRLTRRHRTGWDRESYDLTALAGPTHGQQPGRSASHRTVSTRSRSRRFHRFCPQIRASRRSGRGQKHVRAHRRVSRSRRRERSQIGDAHHRGSRALGRHQSAGRRGRDRASEGPPYGRWAPARPPSTTRSAAPEPDGRFRSRRPPRRRPSRRGTATADITRSRVAGLADDVGVRPHGPRATSRAREPSPSDADVGRRP